ncbi:divalent metal cation transporter, partial [Vibrio alfacsensis]
FHVGYISTIVLALVFLLLGALVFNGSEDQMIQGSVGFTHQLVNLYSSVTGDWSKYIIALIAFLCIYGSAITILDGYGRVLSESSRIQVRSATLRHLSSHAHFLEYYGWLLKS